MMYPETQAEVLRRIERDFSFKRETAEHLRGGICPACKKKELYTFKNDPWILICPRNNHCGERQYIRDLYPDLFEKWEKRFEPTRENPNRTIEAYMTEGRGFPIDKIRGLFTQEYYKSGDNGSVTVRAAITDDPENPGWWQRILDTRGGALPKTTFKYGWTSTGHAWTTPDTDYARSSEIWITEGIFDSIALWLSGITTFSALSCNNYPSIMLQQVAQHCATQGLKRPRLIWAFDADKAGQDGIAKNIEKAEADGWTCAAAQPPVGRSKVDWNDLFMQDRLGFHDLENYRYYGDLLTAERPIDKALLIYKRTGRSSFPFDFGNAMYWFKLDLDKYNSEIQNSNHDDNTDWLAEEKEAAEAEQRDNALKNAHTVTELMDCKPSALYWQTNEETDEQWYFFRIEFPRGKHTIQNTFTGSQLAAASEFKKRLLSIAPGVVYTGTPNQLDQLLKHWTRDIKRVQMINYVGYHAELKTYLLGDIAIQNGRLFERNKEEYFELPQHTNIKAKTPFDLTINTAASDYKISWIDDLIGAYGIKGLICLTAFFGSLFAQQIRQQHKSFPFVEIVGDPGTGKTTLIKFLWKLMGRDNYEGEDPNKTSHSGLTRTFRQVSNLPVLLVESDREGEGGKYGRQFNWDTLKTLYDGGSLGALGVKNNGNETYNPPFMGTIIISQNAQVMASTPIMERIVHVGFKKDALTRDTLAASRRLSKYAIEEVSHFIIDCLKAEKQIMEIYASRLEHHDARLQEDWVGIHNFRVIHNHAQLMAMFDALADVLPIDIDLYEDVHNELLNMAQTRYQSLSADSQIVQNFWDVYEQIETHKSVTDDTVLNHHAKGHRFIAINFAHLYQTAAQYRYDLPDMTVLQDALRHSQSYKFVEANKAISSALQKKTIRCWIFEKPL